jgi:hypothetical protein
VLKLSQAKNKIEKLRSVQCRFYGKRKRIQMDDSQIRDYKIISESLGLSLDKTVELAFRTGFEASVASCRVICDDGKKKIVDSNEASFSKICTHLGLSYESAIKITQQMAVQYDIKENEPILIRFTIDPQGTDFTNVLTTHDYHKVNSGSPNRYSNSLNELKLDLKMTKYSEEEDPILLTREPLMKAFNLNNFGSLLKFIYFLFVQQNNLISPDLYLYGDYANRIRFCDEFKPYGWSNNPMADYIKVKNGSLNFSFLNTGLHINRKPLSMTLKLKDYQGALIRETLHIYCHYLFRSESSFFKMLYMYFLKSCNLLDENFYLHPRWKQRIQRISLFDETEDS